MTESGYARVRFICGLTLEATGTQQAPRSGNLLLCVRMGRKVKHHRVLVERRMPAWQMPPATVLSFLSCRADSLAQGLGRSPWRGQPVRCEWGTGVLPSPLAELPTRKFRVLSAYVAGRSRYFESFLDEDIDEADAHKWIDFDVSHTGRRGNVRYDKVLSIKRGEDFLW